MFSHFCDSLNHISENCDIYISNKSRKEIGLVKNLCEMCLEKNCVSSNFGKCNSIKKCYICFTNEHRTASCSELFTTLCLPKIDHNLFNRFLATFDPLEKYLLALQSPLMFNERYIPQVTVISEEVHLHYNPNFFTSMKTDVQNIIICYEFTSYCHSSDHCQCETFKKVTTDFCTILPETIELIFGQFSPHRQHFTFIEFSLILSSRTKRIKLKNVAFMRRIKFENILEKAPNLEYLEFDKFNNQTGCFDVIKCKYDKKYKKFTITVGYKFIHFDELGALMRNDTSKFTINLHINYYYNHPFNFGVAQKFYNTSKILLKTFAPTRPSNKNSISLYLQNSRPSLQAKTSVFVGSYVFQSFEDRRAKSMSNFLVTMFKFFGQIFLYICIYVNK